MRLLQESKDEVTTTYVYEQDSYVPLARLDTRHKSRADKGHDTRHDFTKFYYFHCNASGMPEEVTDADGNIVWRARYSTWGKLLFENTTLHAPDGFEQNLRMQGQYHDREIDLYYNTFRYYDFDTGRFTTEDPIGLLGGINLYQYAPNPLSWIDPWGWSRIKQEYSSMDEYWKSKRALAQVTPGTREIIDFKPSSRGGGTPYYRVSHYDQYGRLEAQTHYTSHGEPKIHPNPHHHRYDPTTGGGPSSIRNPQNGSKIFSGEYKNRGTTGGGREC